MVLTPHRGTQPAGIYDNSHWNDSRECSFRTRRVADGGRIGRSLGEITGSLSVALRYRVVRESAGCDAAAFTGSPNYVVGSGGPVSLDTSAPVAFPLPAGAGPTLAGPAVPLCFEVSLPATQENWTDATLQSKSLVANWPFEGTS